MRSPTDTAVPMPNTPRLIVSSVLLLAAGVLPVHLAGALAPTLQKELNFNDAQLGFLVAAFFGVAAVLTTRGGALNDRIGPNSALRNATLISITALTLTALLVNSYLGLLGLIVLATLGNSVSQPGTNVLISSGVREQRRGLAFGAKQAGVPVSTLIGGLSARLIVDQWGWRWAYAAAAIVGVVAILMMPKVPHDAEKVSRHATFSRSEKRALHLVALVGVGGAAAVAPIPSFVVLSALDADMSINTAPLLLIGGSVLLIMVRSLSGLAADLYRFDRFLVIIPMLLVGAVGYVLLAVGSPIPTVIGAVLAFGGGWGWPGLFNLGVVERFPMRPGAASGIMQMGIFVGAVLGPAAFGLLAEHVSYQAAWYSSAAWTVLAVSVMVVARRALAAAVPQGVPSEAPA
jgi:predicted MFS family arabinose efflux permease